MGRMKEYYMDTVELEDEIRCISVFTNDEHNPRPDSGWSWVINREGANGQGEVIKKMSDVVGFCECSHCQNSQKEIAECSSLCDALEWVRVNKSGFPVNAYVSSQLLSLAKSEPDTFKGQVEARQSCQLKDVSEQLIKLIQKLEVEIIEFTYANKDILPFYGLKNELSLSE